MFFRTLETPSFGTFWTFQKYQTLFWTLEKCQKGKNHKIFKIISKCFKVTGYLYYLRTNGIKKVLLIDFHF